MLTRITSQLLLVVILSESVPGKASRDVSNFVKTPMKLVISAVHETLTINTCKANTTISYCWLKHPNGTEFTVNSKKDEESLYWYTNTELSAGECLFTLKVGNPSDSGVWTCHMGPYPAGLEILDKVEVRVTGPLTAVQPTVAAKLNEETSLQCVTTGVQSLKYCRFIMPDDTGFEINKMITKNNPIIINGQEYYYKETADLFSGECSVTIAKVSKADYGNWHCYGAIQEEEYKDMIILINNENSLSVASVAGIVIGMMVVVLAFSFLVYVTWSKRQTEQLPARVTWRRSDETQNTAEISIDPRSSNESQSSSTQLTLHPVNIPSYGVSSAPIN